MSPILAARIANPKLLEEIVGFKVKTFYTDSSFTVFWEDLGEMIGKTKRLKTANVEEKILNDSY